MFSAHRSPSGLHNWGAKRERSVQKCASELGFDRKGGGGGRRVTAASERPLDVGSEGERKKDTAGALHEEIITKRNGESIKLTGRGL